MLVEPCQPVFLVCSADDGYAMPLAVTLRSVLENLSDSYRLVVFVIDGGIREHNKTKVLNSLPKCEVNFVPVPKYWLERLGEGHRYSIESGITRHYEISIASYYRLVISELLPQHIEKVIYLDCDLVVEADLGELWQTGTGENYLLAVQDMWTGYVSAPEGLLNYEALGIPATAKYFNAGVLLINLKKWREDLITNKALDYARQNRQYIRFHDQDILNAVVAGKWAELDPKWNLTPRIYDYLSWQESPFSEEKFNQIIREPSIVHFATLKPWKSRWARSKEYFFKYLDMTAWAGWRLTTWRRIRERLFYELKTFRRKFLKAKAV